MDNSVKISSNKNSAANIIFFVLSCFCLFRLLVVAALHAYAYLFFGFIFFLLATHYYYGIRYSAFVFFPLVLVISFLFFVISGDSSENGVLYYVIRFICPFTYYYVTILYITSIKTDTLIASIKALSLLFIFYLLIEIVIRCSAVLRTFRSGDLIESFYFFKKGTISFTDVNFLGLHILNIICLMLFLENYTGNKFWFRCFWIMSLFVLLTLSRSIIITIICLLVIRHICNLLRKKAYLAISFEIIVGVFVVIQLFVFFVSTDGSFRSKLGILDGMKAIEYYPLSNILFGFGFGKGEYAYSYIEGGYGHLHVAVLIGQYGILGTVLFVIFFMFMLIKTKGNCFNLVMAFIISGFSLIDFFNTSFYWVLGIITVLSKRGKEIGI